MDTMDTKVKRETEQQIASEIGRFYFNRRNEGTLQQQVEEATKEVKAIRITRIEFDGKVISITTERPGLLIGRRGEDIKALGEHLHTILKFDTIEITEERVLGNLYSFQYALGFDDDDLGLN